MTNNQVNQLIELGKISPELAATAQELDRLSELTDDRKAKTLLTEIMRGLLSCADDPCEPFMEPVPMLMDEAVHHAGREGIPPIDTVERLGVPTAVWRCRSFIHRLQFLLDSMLVVAYNTHGKLPPICLRLDVKEMGFDWQPDGIPVDY